MFGSGSLGDVEMGSFGRELRKSIGNDAKKKCKKWCYLQGA